MYRILTVVAVLTFSHIEIINAQDTLIYESGGDLIREQAAFDVTHYDLDIKVNPADSTIEGIVRINADIVHPTNIIVIDLDPVLVIESILDLTYNSVDFLNFTRSKESKHVRINFANTKQPGEKLKIEIRYGGNPLVAANPPWDGGFVWEKTPSGEPWIGVACQSIGAWVWWPNKDHPSDKPDSVSLNFTVPENLVVASNGRFTGTSDAGDGWTTWHWFNSTPINNYNITLNAAPYETISESYESVSGDEFELTFWVLPEFYEQGRDLFPQFIDQIRFLEEILGPYPFRADKYGVAHTPYLGMEHQSIIAYGAGFRNGNLFGNASQFDDLHQHELSHEWWGNLVTAWDWRDFWIHEGFGTYMQALYAEHISGAQAYLEMIRVFRQRIISIQEIAPRDYKSTVEVYGSGRGGDIYYKGAVFLHTLRYLIGDELFFKSLRRFAYPDKEMETITDGNHVRFATTDDYLNLVNRITGDDYSWLFEVYLRNSELPVLLADRDQEHLTLEWQIVDDVDFPVPVELSVDGEIITLVPDSKTMELKIPDDARLEIDPGSRILMELKLSGFAEE